MRIIFAGTPLFADTALKALLTADSQRFNVVGVFTQPDRPAGRGNKLTPSPVKQTALAHGIPVLQPQSLRLDGKFSDEALAAQIAIKDVQADVMIVAAYGLILPQWVLDAPRSGCVNIHASLLPRWRGAAPIQRAIAAGDEVSGVCLMQMDAGLDTGAVYARVTVPITPTTTGGELHDALALVGAQMLTQHLPAIVAGSLLAQPQASDGVSYAHKLQRSDGAIDFTRSAADLALQIRALDPSLGCAFEHRGETYKVWSAVADGQIHSTEPGTILNVQAGGVRIACGQGSVLNVTEIQKPGARRIPLKNAWQGLSALLK